MDIARDICTDSFYIVNSGLPCIPVTAVIPDDHHRFFTLMIILEVLQPVSYTHLTLPTKA